MFCAPSLCQQERKFSYKNVNLLKARGAGEGKSQQNLRVIMYSERAPGRMGEFSWTKSLLLTRENTKHCSSEIDPRLQHNYRTNILGHKRFVLNHFHRFSS